MATKDYCLSYKRDVLVDPQYSSLNLNKASQSHEKPALFLKSDLNERKKAVTHDYTVENNFKPRKDSNSWKKSNKNLMAMFLKDDSEDKNELKKLKNTKTNSSTLSLHIAAYENSIETSTGSAYNGNESLTIKKWKNANQLVLNPGTIIHNLFEFPRQQENEKTKILPEVAQFHASQTLLNPNQISGNDTRAFRRAPAASSTNLVIQQPYNQNEQADTYRSGIGRSSTNMSFRGVRGISKNYNKNGVLIYHGEHQSFVFVVRDERNEAQCVQCRWLCKNSNRAVQIYQIQGDTFESDPSVPEHHCCKPMTKDFVEAQQLYRETLREVSGTKISPDEAFTKLEENFERFYGSNCFKSIMKKNLSSQKQIKKTFWKRSNKGKLFNEEEEEDDENDDEEEEEREIGREESDDDDKQEDKNSEDNAGNGDDDDNDKISGGYNLRKRNAVKYN